VGLLPQYLTTSASTPTFTLAALSVASVLAFWVAWLHRCFGDGWAADVLMCVCAVVCCAVQVSKKC
jgi:hypothetical protein